MRASHRLLSALCGLALSAAPAAAAAVESPIAAPRLSPAFSAALASPIWSSLATADSAVSAGEMLKSALSAPSAPRADIDAVALAVRAAQDPVAAAAIQGPLEQAGFAVQARVIRHLSQVGRDPRTREAFARAVAPLQSTLAQAGAGGSLDDLRGSLDKLFTNAGGSGSVAEPPGSAVAAKGLGARKRLAGLAPATPRGRPAKIEVPEPSFDLEAKPAGTRLARNGLLKLGESLRAGNIDPRATNIPEFAAQVPAHVRFARKAIESHGADKESMEILAEFEREALARVKDGKATYEWWNDFNYRLSILITPRAMRTHGAGGGRNDDFADKLLASGSWRTDEGFRQAARRIPKSYLVGFVGHDAAASFPGRILLPTIEGNLSIENLNELYGSNINPAGLIADRVEVDGKEMYPDRFYRHDHGHASNEEFTAGEVTDDALRGLQKDYLGYRGSVPGKRRPVFEAGYFLATHEQPFAVIDLIESGRAGLAGEKELIERVRDPAWYAGLVPEWASKSDAAAGRFLRMADDEMRRFAAWRAGGKNDSVRP